MPRIRFPDIRIRRSEAKLAMQLQSLVYSYRTGEIPKPELRLRGEQTLRKHYESTSHDIEQWMTTQGIQLTVEDKKEHKALLGNALVDWGRIIDDVKRM